jgi:hypothetical protein
VAAPELARAGPALSALESLSSLSTQQFRPAELTGSTNELVHSTPLQPITGGTFASLGGSGDIRGQIVWMTNADIDLKSLVPDGTLVYFANRTATLAPGTTAQLDHDNLGGVIDVAPDKRVENISVTGPNIPAGSYAFFAHSFSGNNGGLPTTVQIRVTGDGNRTAITDSVTLSEDAYSNKYIVDYKGSAVAPTYRVAPQ